MLWGGNLGISLIHVSMMPMPKLPKDANQRAKMMVDIATGEIEMPKTEDGKDPAAVALGRKGGLKGGRARADALSKEERAAIAKKAAAKRWANKGK